MFFHRFGKRVIIPKRIIIPPENIFQKRGSISIKNVVALRIRVKTMIEAASEPIIVYAFDLFSPS